MTGGDPALQPPEEEDLTQDHPEVKEAGTA
jgi:hypothetical protein